MFSQSSGCLPHRIAMTLTKLHNQVRHVILGNVIATQWTGSVIGRVCVTKTDVWGVSTWWGSIGISRLDSHTRKTMTEIWLHYVKWKWHTKSIGPHSYHAALESQVYSWCSLHLGIEYRLSHQFRQSFETSRLRGRTNYRQGKVYFFCFLCYFVSKERVDELYYSLKLADECMSKCKGLAMRTCILTRWTVGDLIIVFS